MNAPDNGWQEFQLTTSRRGRPGKIVLELLAPHFNSRPHEEVDATMLMSLSRH